MPNIFLNILLFIFFRANAFAGEYIGSISLAGDYCFDAGANPILGEDGRVTGIGDFTIISFIQHENAASGDDKYKSTAIERLPLVLSQGHADRECPWGAVSVQLPNIGNGPFGRICLLPSPSTPQGKTERYLNDDHTQKADEIRRLSGIDQPLWFRGCVRVQMGDIEACSGGEKQLQIYHWITPDLSMDAYSKFQFNSTMIERCVKPAP